MSVQPGGGTLEVGESLWRPVGRQVNSVYSKQNTTLGGFSDGNVLLLPVLEADRCGQVWFLLESLCLACRRLPSRCVLSGRCHPSVCVRSISSCKASSQTRWGPTLTASFQRNPPFKDLISKHTPILRYWGLGLPHMNLVGGTQSASRKGPGRGTKWPGSNLLFTVSYWPQRCAGCGGAQSDGASSVAGGLIRVTWKNPRWGTSGSSQPGGAGTAGLGSSRSSLRGEDGPWRLGGESALR